MGLPIGDKPVNRQTGYEALRKTKKPLGFSVGGKITKALLAALARGEDRGWDHTRER
jgi:hypothetical protein